MQLRRVLILISAVVLSPTYAVHTQTAPDSGLKAEITGVSIPANRRPVITFKISDAKGKALDLDDLDHEFAAAFNGGNNIPELRPYLQDWQAMVKDNTAQVNLVRDYYRLLRLIGVQNLDLNDPADSARMGTLARFSQILADF